MSGTLFVVATPLGNMEDVTLRALRVLREVDLVAAEDTRRTARLLNHYAITTPSTSFHQHNVWLRLPQLIARLQAGRSVALVTDAGTPGISDPGAELVQACVDAQIRIDSIPGPSAPITAAVASGFPLIPLTIFGFPPTRSKDRKLWVASIAETRHTLTFFESPHRILSTLIDISAVLGERQITLARELTKVHQEFLRGSVSLVRENLVQLKGEITVVVGPATVDNMSNDQLTEADVLAMAVAKFGQLTKAGSPRRAAMTAAAREFDLSVRAVYAAVEKTKKPAE